MKKILMLGGSRYLIPVIKKAKELGYYTITCDYLPNNIAHKYSDEYHNVSIVEKDRILELAKSLKVDGIMSFACDPGVVTAAYVSEKMGLPSPGSYESVCILQNKGRFRKFLEENGFVVPQSASFRSREGIDGKLQGFKFPVIVKPTDSAGSKGVSKVDDIADLDEAVSNALVYSLNGEFIIEEFIESAGFSSDSDSFSVNGELKLASFSSQRFDSGAVNPYTPAAYSWPSSMTREQKDELTSEIQRLLKLLGMKTSIYNVETRVGKDGKAYIMEVSPRGGGNRLAEMLKYVTGTDLIENAIQAAVGETINDSFSNTIYGHWAEVILHADNAGDFDGLWIDESIKSNVIEEDIWIKAGTRIKPFKAANEAIGTLVLKFATENELSRVMDHIGDYIHIKVK